MTFKILGWFENNCILLALTCIVLFAFLGPGLLGLAPPKWHINDREVEAARSEETVSPDILVVDSEQFTPSGVNEQVGLAARPSVAEPGMIAPSPIIENPVGIALRGSDSADLLVTQPKPEVVRFRNYLYESIPASHFGLSGEAQKRSFLDMMLPLITAANAEIDARRAAIIGAANARDRLTLEKWARLYKIQTIDLDDAGLRHRLLRRADRVPVPIALAQAALESGWGTSRFAKEGNALFGQWAWKKDAGMYPREAENDRFVVRSFASLYDSVRAYIHNLNTHANYADFRAERAVSRDVAAPIRTDRLLNHLHGYAEIGQTYVEKLRELIARNDFYRYSISWF